VCINQADNHEKNEQVAMMAKIYREARRVLAWIGTTDDKSIRALYHFKRITDSASKYGVDTEIDHLVLMDYNGFDVALITGASSEDLQRSFSRVPQQVACIGINPTRCTPVQEILRGSDSEIETLLKSADASDPHVILERSWFSRIWIVQEVISAKLLIIHCGREILDWKYFAAACFLLLLAQDRTKYVLDC
jgi:hypothetical protein